MTFQMLVMWVLAGLLAGGLAGFVLKRGGHGRMADIALGLSGALVGSWMFHMLRISPEAGLFAIVVVAFVGASGVIVAQRKIWPTIA
ncbi:MAG: GlsB/YeaQ/YmgE family stress response membrane protein [Candidatus Rokuibacteriota bacterium]